MAEPMTTEVLWALERTHRNSVAAADRAFAAKQAAVLQAVAEGMPKVRIAQAMGLSRERVRQLTLSPAEVSALAQAGKARRRKPVAS